MMFLAGLLTGLVLALALLFGLALLGAAQDRGWRE